MYVPVEVVQETLTLVVLSDHLPWSQVTVEPDAAVPVIFGSSTIDGNALFCTS